MYSIELDKSFEKRFNKLPREIQVRIWKKIKLLKEGLTSRHLQFGVDYFVEEVGQYRICYKSFEDANKRVIYFVGKHKEYEKWIRKN